MILFRHMKRANRVFRLRARNQDLPDIAQGQGMRLCEYSHKIRWLCSYHFLVLV